jgi:hypothetical protein
MSDSLFLDPFAVPSSDPHAHDGRDDSQQQSPSPQDSRNRPQEPVVAGTVLGSAPASENATEAVTAVVPLELEQAVGAVVDDTHLWWPRDRRATGADGHVYVEDGKLLEEDGTGGFHVWAEIVGTAAAELELDWFGGGSPRDPVNEGESGLDSGASEPAGHSSRRDAVPKPGTGTRLFLGFEPQEQGTAVTVRGSAPGPWRNEWTALLESLGRFTGGELRV